MLTGGEALRALLEHLLCARCTIFFNWGIVALQCCVSFLVYDKVNQLYVYIYSLPLGLPSHPTPASHPSRPPQSTKLSPLCSSCSFQCNPPTNIFRGECQASYVHFTGQEPWSLRRGVLPQSHRWWMEEAGFEPRSVCLQSPCSCLHASGRAGVPLTAYSHEGCWSSFILAQLRKSLPCA